MTRIIAAWMLFAAACSDGTTTGIDTDASIPRPDVGPGIDAGLSDAGAADAGPDTGSADDAAVDAPPDAGPCPGGCDDGNDCTTDDCDEEAAACTHDPIPPTTEVCNGIDDDCDGTVDDLPGGMMFTYYRDLDGDEYGDPFTTTFVPDCMPPAGYTTDSSDCWDASSATHPGAEEVCNGNDDDCDYVFDGVPAHAECVTRDPADPICLYGRCDHPVLVTAGPIHSCALFSSGRMTCWGSGRDGRRGDFMSTDDAMVGDIPQEVLMVNDAVHASAGRAHTCIVRQDSVTGVRTAGCFGANDHGQLGDPGYPLGSALRVVVPGLSDVLAVAAGDDHSCAVMMSGALWCWGRNHRGQLGDGTTTNRSSPTRVPGVTDAIAVTAGGMHTCVLERSGAVKCFGEQSSGRLGNGADTTASISTPVAVDVPVGPAVIGLDAGTAHTCAVRMDGTLLCWGLNDSGQLGVAGAFASRPAVVPITGVTAVSAGVGFSCALRGSGAAACWGANARGQLGDGSTTARPAPTDVTGLTAITVIAAGGQQTCAVAGDHTWCWGANEAGQLGNHDRLDRNAPEEVRFHYPFVPP